MKRFLSVFLAVLMLCALCLTSCSSVGKGELKPIAKEDLKFAFLYVGPVGDLGYSYAHDQARKAVEKELGINIHHVESVEEGPNCETTLRQLCEEGYNVIYATSFGHGEWVEKVAKDYPDVYFGHATGYIEGPNYGNYMGRIYEARYLAGIVAGLNTYTNKIGYVAAMPIAEVIRGINAFTLGVKSVNPDAVVEVKWTNTWYDEAKEREYALELINGGCDVMAQHCDSTAPQKAAQEMGVLAIGYNASTQMEAPNAYLTAPLFNWEVFYKQDIEKIMNGKWKGETYWTGLSTGMVSLDKLTDLCAPGTQEAVDAAKEKIISGELVIFSGKNGEIKDNKGNVVVKADQTLTDAELTSMNWLVEGVKGSIPEAK